MVARVYRGRSNKNKPRKATPTTDTRIQSAGILILTAAVIVVGRLFFLMVLQHDLYTALAAGAQEVYAELIPERGRIYMQDTRSGEAYPVAMNRDYYLVYLDTRAFDEDTNIGVVTSTIAKVLGITDPEELEKLTYKAQKVDDPYEPVREKVPEATVALLRAANIDGLGFIRRSYRFYPEGQFAGPLIGFLGKNSDGTYAGKYGIEGHFDTALAGSGGFFAGKKSASGLWITTAGRSEQTAEDGADVYTTIDRQLQFTACTKLAEAKELYQAVGAALVIMDPTDGAILAACSLPDFNPNEYGNVPDISVYNNSVLFTPYEVGSVFKPLVMAAAINEELVDPSSYFYDSGTVDANCTKPIGNADSKVYEHQTMTGVLENSINTGMVHVAGKLGKETMISYIEQMGFGIKTGISLDTEASGTINTLYQNDGDDIDCYAATASFGQGFTATPIQMATAYSAIANGGTIVEPHVVEKFVYPDGRVERYKPTERPSIFSSRTTGLIGGMMVSVVDNGHAGGAGVEGYYLAGKTGTAQISGVGGYSDETYHSFVGYGPVANPKFVMYVTFEQPQRRFSSQTAAPVFGDIASWLLTYYGVPKER